MGKTESPLGLGCNEGLGVNAEELLPHAYLLAKVAMVMPLFQEARDALTAVREDQRVRHGISKTLAERMDIAGMFSLDDWARMNTNMKSAAPAVTEETALPPLVLCPLCGGASGYVLGDGSTHRWWIVLCADCGADVAECRSDGSTRMDAPKPARWTAADEEWNAAGAHAASLRAELAQARAMLASPPPAQAEPPAPTAQAGLSWDGHNITGDEKSICRVRALLETNGNAEAFQRELCEARAQIVSLKAVPAALQANASRREAAAVSTLEMLRYVYLGAELWRPPLVERGAVAMREQCALLACSLQKQNFRGEYIADAIRAIPLTDTPKG